MSSSALTPTTKVGTLIRARLDRRLARELCPDHVDSQAQGVTTGRTR